jgi:single-stranded DNA-binding protein
MMEASVNRVELLGRTGNQLTLRQTHSGIPLTQSSLYTHQIWRNAVDQLCEATERHTITAWGQLAMTQHETHPAVRLGLRVLLQQSRRPWHTSNGQPSKRRS